LKWLHLAAVGLGCALAAAAGASDMILTNGKINTVNDELPRFMELGVIADFRFAGEWTYPA